MTPYQKLEQHFSEYTALLGVQSLVGWDTAVMMPPAGAPQRARQSAALALHLHRLLTDPQVGEWLALADAASLDDWQRANLRVIRRLHRHAIAVPDDLITQRKLQEEKTERLWRRAREEGDFSVVAGDLDALLSIVRDVGAAKSAVLGLSVYDTFLDAYAPGMTAVEMGALFDDLSAFLPPVLQQVLQRQPTPLPLTGPFPAAAQEKLNRAVAALLGFDFSGGRLDVSTHPFSSGAGGDVRITTRYDESDFFQSLRPLVHEVGHALYDRHTPEAWRHQPVGSANAMGMVLHESQSLSLDMHLFRQREFFDLIAPHIAAAFGRADDPALRAENLIACARRVERGFIRVTADEVTYPLHVILRTRLEQRMLVGGLAARDLPQAWNAEFQALFGIAVPDDRRGCLQDIHWYAGYFGYFPTYALGALLAAQWVERLCADIPDVYARLASDGAAAFTGWLRDHVQARGCLLTPSDLIRAETGTELSTRAFKQHIRRRYLGEE